MTSVKNVQECDYFVKKLMFIAGLKPRWREVAAQVPEAVVTVLCTPDEGCG